MTRCGQHPGHPAEAVGCGKLIDTEAEVYRCTDCGVPFHRVCAVLHFDAAGSSPVGVNWRASCLQAEARGDQLLALARLLRQGLGGREQDPTCSCMRCTAIRRWESFMAAYTDARVGGPRT